MAGFIFMRDDSLFKVGLINSCFIPAKPDGAVIGQAATSEEVIHMPFCLNIQLWIEEINVPIIQAHQ